MLKVLIIYIEKLLNEIAVELIDVDRKLLHQAFYLYL